MTNRATSKVSYRRKCVTLIRHSSDNNLTRINRALAISLSLSYLSLFLYLKGIKQSAVLYVKGARAARFNTCFSLPMARVLGPAFSFAIYEISSVNPSTYIHTIHTYILSCVRIDILNVSDSYHRKMRTCRKEEKKGRRARQPETFSVILNCNSILSRC